MYEYVCMMGVAKILSGYYIWANYSAENGVKQRNGNKKI